ncbi:MAG: NTP transferase domain-containing protein [Candidatus Nitrosocaldus sp.]
MIALIMAGGRGSRFAMDEEKPLVKINDKSMISYVIDALLHSKCFNTVIVALSNNTLKTKRYLINEYGVDHTAGYGDVGRCSNCKIRLVDTPAHGYVLDLNSLIMEVGRGCNGYMHERYNLFITPADLPLLDGHIVRHIVEIASSDRYDSTWITVMTNKALLDSLGVSCSECIDSNGSVLCYTGISIVNALAVSKVPAVIDEDHIILNDVRIAVNVNTLEDLKVAERILMQTMQD